jgi:LacI family transcriptional regulator
MNVTISDVAMVAKVSTATVSRVLNGIGKVSPETRRRVEAAVESTGYRPNIMARGLMRARTDSVGILVTHIVNPYHMQIVHALEGGLGRRNVFCYLCNSGGDKALEERYARELIHRAVDALFIIEGAHSDRIGDSYYASLAEQVPLILVNEHLDLNSPAHIVRCAQEPGIREAFSHLKTRGRKRIALVTGTGHYSFELKERLFSEFIIAENLDPEENRVYRIDEANDPEAAHRAAELAIHLCSEKIRPDAIFAANDLLAAGALQGVLSAGVAIPEQASIIGVDDIVLSRVSRPRLSTVSLMTEELGEAAAEAYDTIRGMSPGNEPLRKVLSSRLIIRESS